MDMHSDAQKRHRILGKNVAKVAEGAAPGGKHDGGPSQKILLGDGSCFFVRVFVTK